MLRCCFYLCLLLLLKCARLEIRVWFWFCYVGLNISSLVTIPLMKGGLNDLHIELLLLSLIVAAHIMCET